MTCANTDNFDTRFRKGGSAMSDTPRTDKAARDEIGMGSIGVGWYVHADFARQLERELAAALKAMNGYREQFVAVTAERDALRIDNANMEKLLQGDSHDGCAVEIMQLRADNERLKAMIDSNAATHVKMNEEAWREINALKALLREWVIEQKYSPEKLKEIRNAIG